MTHVADEPSDPQFGQLPTIDMTTPSAARVYDYLLGGGSNFQVDREFADRVIGTSPNAVELARLNRSFLGRAVRYLLGAGVRQFLDLGSGIPTAGNTHQVAEQAGVTDARTMYVDREGVAYHHARQMLRDNPNAAVLQGDMRDVAAVLEHPDTRKLLDFSQPIAVLVFAVLPYFSDEHDPGGMLRAYREHLCPGSYLALSTFARDEAPPDLYAETVTAQEMYRRMGEPVYFRTWNEVNDWFAGTELVEPGLVLLPDWHPDDDSEQANPARTLGYGGVGRVTG
jgi:S-adenosyl methyltransferase